MAVTRKRRRIRRFDEVYLVYHVLRRLGIKLAFHATGSPVLIHPVGALINLALPRIDRLSQIRVIGIYFVPLAVCMLRMDGLFGGRDGCTCIGPLFPIHEVCEPAETVFGNGSFLLVVSRLYLL